MVDNDGVSCVPQICPPNWPFVNPKTLECNSLCPPKTSPRNMICFDCTDSACDACQFNLDDEFCIQCNSQKPFIDIDGNCVSECP